MSSIITTILNTTVGLLVNKGRDVAAKKLKDGDVTDQQFRNLVVRELDDIKSKIDGLARMYLFASVSFFKEGLVFLYQLLDEPEFEKCDSATTLPGMKDEKLAVSLPSASGRSKLLVKASSLVEELKLLKLNALNETAKQLLADAKNRFGDARRKATEAFSNESLTVSDRVLAMKIRIMATLMEKVDNPSTALASCRLCLEELHSIPAVQSYFEVEVTKSFRSWFNKNERHKAIAEVCHINFVVYRITEVMGGDVLKLSVVEIAEMRINPLRDGRLMEALKEFEFEHYCLEWTFGQEGYFYQWLVGPDSITTNTQGQFIVIDVRNVKVFDPSGKFLRSLCPLTEDEQKQVTFRPWRLATDGSDKLYVAVSLMKRSLEALVMWRGVYVFDKHYNLHHKFSLREEVCFEYLYPVRGGLSYCYEPSLTVSNDDKVFVSVNCYGVPQVDVYGTDGRFIFSFGQEILSPLTYDIAIANDHKVMVLDGKTNCVHVFSTQGDLLHQFVVKRFTPARNAIAFHQPSEHVIVSSWNPDNEDCGQLLIYTINGEFVRSVHVNTAKKPFFYGLAVTVDGHVAVIASGKRKVHVIQYQSLI